MNRSVQPTQRGGSPARDCRWQDSATLHVLGSLSGEQATAYVEHLAGCGACAEELELARETVARVDLSVSEAQLAGGDDGRPSAGVRERLLERIQRETQTATPAGGLVRTWQLWDGVALTADAPSPLGAGLHSVASSEGAWEPIGIDGIDVKRLSVDRARRYVTMLVRMAPGTAYPRHRHAGAEECFVLSGDLRVGERVLHGGDFQVAAANSVHGVQSTDGGCTLLIVSSQDDELL